jgi:hypothetical protein
VEHVIVEDQVTDYQILLRNYLHNQEELAELRKRLKRIGRNFVSLGNSLMLNPAATAVDSPSFLADTVNLWDMLVRYTDLTREQAARKLQLTALNPPD